MEARVFQPGGERRETIRHHRQVLLRVESHRVTTSDGLTLHMVRRRAARARGVLPVAILLHGLCQNRHTWHLSDRSFSAYLADAGFDLFVPELRGHGRSEGASDAFQVRSFADFAQGDVPAMLEAVGRISDGGRIFLVGHGLGGTLGYAQAPQQQSRLAGLVQLAAPPLLTSAGRLLQALAWVLQCLRRQPTSRAIAPGAVPAGAALRLLVPYLDRPDNRFPLQLWEPRSIRREVLFERVRLGFERQTLGIAQQALHWMLREWLSTDSRSQNLLEALRLPILAIHGDHDPMVSLSAVQSALDRTHSRDITLVRAGDDGKRHYGHLDLVLGDRAAHDVWPQIRDWMLARA